MFLHVLPFACLAGGSLLLYIVIWKCDFFKSMHMNYVSKYYMSVKDDIYFNVVDIENKDDYIIIWFKTTISSF